MEKVDGKLISGKISKNLKSLFESFDYRPILSVVSVGQNDVGKSFVGSKINFGKKIGVETQVHSFEPDVDLEVLRLSILSIVDSSDGVVVQLPLPDKMDERKILNLVPTEKDPDVLNSFSRESFEKCRGILNPPVAGAVGEIFKKYGINPRGKKVLVVGKGKLVGAPVSAWLRCQGVLSKSIDKTNSSMEIEEALLAADIIISGIGVSGFIEPKNIKEGAVLIDAGTSGRSGQIAGDFDPKCEGKASLFTPVPGGIGPIVVAKLFENLSVLMKNKTLK